MRQRQIKLKATGEVIEFVSAAEKCNFEIDVFYNRVTIDAKSIIGVLGLDLTKVLTVEYFGSDSQFENVLEKFAA